MFHNCYSFDKNIHKMCIRNTHKNNEVKVTYYTAKLSLKFYKKVRKPKS